MMNGDLANTAGITIGFRCEDFLIKYKDSKFSDKVLNAVIGKLRRAEIDETIRSCMENLYRNTEYNVDLIIERKNYTEDLKRIVDNLPFNRVVLIDKLSQISSRLLTGDLTLYVDGDDYRRSLVNSPYSVNLEGLNNLLKLRRARM